MVRTRVVRAGGAIPGFVMSPRQACSQTGPGLEEIGMGRAARHLAQAKPGHVHRGHDLWNISLKFTCES
jgi:hypothetical protein